MERKIVYGTEVMQARQELQLLTVKDVCQYLNVGHWMVYKLIGEKKLKSITIGKRRLIPAQALQEFIAQSEDDTYA